MSANYGVPLRAMFPNVQIIIGRFHIIQLAMKAVQSTRITLQQTINNKRSRIYKLLKSNWQFFITDQSKIDTTQSRWFKEINRRIKQIGRTAYGYGYGYSNSLNYFLRIRLQLFNRKHINASFMNLLTKKACESDKIIRFTSYISQTL